MDHPTYRVGVIGAGRKGTSHARAYALNPKTEVVAVADPDEENRELFRRRFGGVPGYADYREMLAVEGIDIAAPILPVRPNPEVVIGCAEAAGVRAILCEKPIAASLADADRMVETCSARGVRLAAGDLDRNLPGFWRAKEFLDAGEFGDVKSIEFFGGSGTELSGGGCQIFSLMRLFAADAPVEFVIGWVDGDPSSDRDQGGAGYVRFATGVEGILRRQGDGRGRGFEVACEGGVLRYDNEVLSLWRAPGGARLGRDLMVEGVLAETSAYGRRHGGEFSEDGWRWPGDRNVASVQTIIDALDRDEEPRSSGDNGRRVLELAIAVRESHRRGHIPVRLPLPDRSLRIDPHPSRMENKKQILGHEAYMEQLGQHTNFGMETTG